MCLGADEDGKIRGYMCLTDYECEMGLAACGHSIYPTIELCRELCPCVAQCGIARVVVELEDVVQEPDYGDLGPPITQDQPQQE